MLVALETAGVAAMIFKGVDSILRFYQDPGVRPMDDADLLVHRSERDAAADALARQGYERVQPCPGRFDWLGAPAAAEWTFRKSNEHARVEVDLHWRVVADGRLRAVVDRLDEGMLWSRRVPGQLGGATLSHPSDVDAALITAILQGLGHPWSHPLGYLDFHVIVDGWSNGHWNSVATVAHQTGAARLLYWTMRFSAELFGTEVPREVLAALAPPVATRFAGERLIGRDWIGRAGWRREMSARDLFVAAILGPTGLLRMLNARADRAESRESGTAISGLAPNSTPPRLPGRVHAGQPS